MFKSFFSRLASAFRGGFQNIFNVLVPIVQSGAGKLIDAALPIAIGFATEAAQNLAIPSAQKREVVVNQLRDALIAQGKATAVEATASVLNLVVEMAVNHLKATSPQKP